MRGAIRQAALGALCAAAVAASVVLVARARAGERRSAKVTFLSGEAFDEAGGKGAKVRLEKGALVFEHDVVETGEAGKLELKTKDGSVVRLGPSSRLVLERAAFGPKGEKHFSAKLFFGRVWSKVSGLVGGDSKFQVETENAVAGVRGTTFRVDARRDKSVILKVYAGSVAMASPTVVQKQVHTGRRTQISGPNRITANAWEKLVGAMMQLSVNSDGTVGDPTPFSLKDDNADDWAAWNRMMDKQEGGH